MIKFSEIKIDDRFHLFPFKGFNECNIRIDFKSENYASYSVINPNKNTDLFGRIFADSEMLNHLIPLSEYNGGSYKKEICNKCPFFLVKDTTQGVSYLQNCYCGGVNAEKEKIIDWSIRFNSEVPTPAWCPKKTNSLRNIGEGGYTWRDIKPRINFNDIKVGEEYHVAPYDNEGRKDIRIVSKVNNYCTYKIISEEKKYSSYYYVQDGGIYENSLILKFMSKKKK
jgi:hypothetical protein